MLRIIQSQMHLEETYKCIIGKKISTLQPKLNYFLGKTYTNHKIRKKTIFELYT